jgi:PAS domain-containing protein
MQVHQIELEMQNEELMLAKDRAEIAMEKYTSLYDFAPSGYLTLSKEGSIVNLNFEAARLLGKDRISLINTCLKLYIQPDSLNIYYHSFNEAFKAKSKKTCELYLLSKNEKPIFVHIDAFFLKTVTNVY